MPAKATRGEIQSIISSKADSSQVAEQISDLRTHLANRTVLLDFQAKLDQKVSHSELTCYLSTKATLEDLNGLTEAARSNKSFEAAIQDLYARLGALQSESAKYKASLREVEGIKAELSRKADLQEVEDKLKCTEERMKASRSELETGLSRKAENSEIQRILAALECVDKALSRKLDTSEMEHKYIPMISLKTEKRDFEALTDYLRELKNDNQTVAAEQSNEVSTVLLTVRKDMETLKNELNLALAGKADNLEVDKVFNFIHNKPDAETVHDWMSQQKKDLYDSFNCKMQDFKANMKNSEENLGQRVTAANVKLEYLGREHEQLAANANQFKEEVKSKMSSSKTELRKGISSLASDLDKTYVNHTVFKEALHNLSIKIEHQEGRKHSDSLKQLTENLNSLTQQIATKLPIKEFTQAFSEIQRVLETTVTKLDLQQVNLTDAFEDHKQATQKTVESLANNLVSKGNLLEFSTFLDSKAAVEDVNSALLEIHRELDAKGNSTEISEFMQEQALINETLCSENAVARWIWKNRETQSNKIPWDIQSINTCPENFVWSNESSYIIVEAPGLYEITLGFFAKKKPMIQLLVNGEPVLSAVNNPNSVVYHSSGRLKNISGHPSGNITGLTLIDFIVLPARAKVGISYTGETNAEGFMGLRKL